MGFLNKKTSTALCVIPVLLMVAAGSVHAKPKKPKETGGSEYDQFLICKKKPKACGSTADVGKPKPKPKPKPNKRIGKLGIGQLNYTPISKAVMR